jgi:peptidoglycan hydrolase-like protein with peptidoglycan-binding domain
VVAGKAPSPVTAAAGPKPPPYPGRELHRDDHQARADPALKTWQERMIARGYRSIGAADGKFGPKTERVVRAFQKLCRVQVDGRIGPKTWPLPWTRPLGS